MFVSPENKIENQKEKKKLQRDSFFEFDLIQNKE